MEWRQEIEEEGSKSSWSDSGSDVGIEDMQVDRPDYQVNITQSAEDELNRVFEEEGGIVDKTQLMKEKAVPLFGGTPIHPKDLQYRKAIDTEQGLNKPEDLLLDDEQALNKLLNVRSFKEIQGVLNKRKSRDEIEEELKKLKPVYKEKRFKTHHDSMEVESCMKEPLNLSFAYSTQYTSENLSCIMSLSQRSQNYRPYTSVPKWPYKTLTERLILNDLLLMLKGLNSVSNFILEYLQM